MAGITGAGRTVGRGGTAPWAARAASGATVTDGAATVRTFRKGHFDEVLFGEMFARHDRSLEDVRKAFVGMGARIHDALDEGQRERLATIIEQGPRAFGRSGWGRARA